MVMETKLAAAGAVAVLGLMAGDVCTCPPPETETISCVDGHASFAAATCTQQVTESLAKAGPLFHRVTLTCPPGETAISGGYREDLTDPPLVRVLEAAPFAPVGGHAHAYKFTWREGLQPHLKVFITCQRV